ADIRSDPCRKARPSAVSYTTPVDTILFEYSGEEDSRPKRLSEVGGMHLCFEVDDVHACAERLRAQGVDMLDGPNLVESGPLRGFNWIYFRPPWGLMLEAASFNRLGYESNSSHRLWSAKPA
ncbi:VOC family protein, partial [Rhizobium ruizarguesonis]